jgi:hypothetical protein
MRVKTFDKDSGATKKFQRIEPTVKPKLHLLYQLVATLKKCPHVNPPSGAITAQCFFRDPSLGDVEDDPEQSHR